jgi:4-amino-4-deoxy-L-arabinose transferase-like glycosyltransferase
VIALVGATVAILAAATVFAGAMPARGTLTFLAAVGLLAYALVIVTIGACGILLGTLDPMVLLTASAAWLLPAALLAYRRRGQWRWRARTDEARSTAIEVLRWPPVRVATALVVATLCWRTFLALRLPVVDYDGWSYHLVFVDVWLQHSALVPVLQRPWTAGYPAAGELLTTWLMAFTGSDALAGFTSLLPIPLAIVVTAGLARAFGAGRRSAALAGLVFGMTPALVGLAGTSYVDAASVATVVATWWFGLRVVRGQRDPSLVLLLGVASGLALGTKGSNALLVGPVVAVAGLVLLVELARGRPAGRREAVLRLAVFAVPLFVIGGSWYFKNIVQFGNPLYPFAIGPLRGVTTLADFQLAPEQLERRSYLGKLVTSWTWDWRLSQYPYNVRPGGLGRAWPLILAGATAGGALLAARRSWAVLALVVAPAAVTLAIMPMNWYARLTLFLVAVALALVAVALDALRSRWRTAAGLALVAVAAVSLVFVNARPNLDLRPQVSRISSPGAYLRLLLADDATRQAISLRATCAAFDQIPAGTRVAPGGFNLLHAAVGHRLDRILTDTIEQVDSPEALVAAMDKLGSTWLVTRVDGENARLAAALPNRFRDHGESCEGSRLWELRPAGGSV